MSTTTQTPKTRTIGTSHHHAWSSIWIRTPIPSAIRRAKTRYHTRRIELTIRFGRRGWYSVGLPILWNVDGGGHLCPLVPRAGRVDLSACPRPVASTPAGVAAAPLFRHAHVRGFRRVVLPVRFTAGQPDDPALPVVELPL